MKLWSFERRQKAIAEAMARARIYEVKETTRKPISMTEEEIYNEHEAFLNHIFANTSSEVKSYNVFDEMHEFIEELKNVEPSEDFCQEEVAFTRAGNGWFPANNDMFAATIDNLITK